MSSSPLPVHVVVLAAGGSRRLGRPKQLVTLDGEGLLRRAARIACEAKVGPVRVVLGAHAAELAPHLAGLPLEVSVHPRWEDGVGTSIAWGVRGLSGPVLLCACDQPAVDAEHLRALVAIHARSGGGRVASAYAGSRGIPAVFPAADLAQLRNLSGDRGARALLTQPGVAELPLPGGEDDVDTEDDVGRLGGR